ncbi:MAG: hypothetical protein AMS17_01780 [Spirochaetes bacterium DG_61]|nr:MAG: hypothetical protein AMS17_01780 [Spirochaetes bacterium DG_61]
MSSKSEKYKHTDTVIEGALKKARELGIKKIVVASCTGFTAQKLLDCGLEVVCVTHQIGFHKPGKDEMELEMRKKLQDKGVKILTTTHLMAGIDRALRLQFEGVYPSEIVATTLRMFGEGVKVCVEISIMATDAGLVEPGKDIIALGGTGWGADTAAVINPSHSQHFFKTKVREIICKPSLF